MQNKQIKQKKCKSCGDPFTPWNSMAKVCGPACALKFAQQQSAKNIAKTIAQRKKDFLANDVKFQKVKAQKAFNEFIRLRDALLGCVSCDKGTDWQGQWHASHWKSRGARPDLAFNEDNVHKSCSICNNWLSGNPIPFRDQLLVRIGEERVAALEADTAQPRKLKAVDYAEIADQYRKKIKDLLKPI